MPVGDFLKIDDAKHTVERPAPNKPTTEELTTIESPGRPVPASNFIKKPYKKKPPKKTTRKKRAKTQASSISPAKRDSILIITEKPQAALKIAQALAPAPSQVKKLVENKVSYFEISPLSTEESPIIVASAVGHLFTLSQKEGQTGWPIFQTEWVPSHTKKGAAFTKRYLDLLKKLSKKAKETVIATDYDIEGEVIGWNVLRFASGLETAKRMKYSTLTKAELQKSYENLLPQPDWGQAYAGESRHIADWLYGINLSRGLMAAIKTTGAFKILSIGRVQGPALKIIVDREREIESFESEPYWQAFAHVNNHPYKHPKDIFDKSQLLLFYFFAQILWLTKKHF